MKMTEIIRHQLKHLIWSSVLIIAATCSCPSAAAQETISNTPTLADNEPTAEKVEEQTTVKPASKTSATPAAKAPKQLKIGDVDFSGSLRLRVENYGWFRTPGFEDVYTFGAAVLRLSLGQQKERYDWQIEGEFPVLINLPDKATAPAPQGQLGLGAS